MSQTTNATTTSTALRASYGPLAKTFHWGFIAIFAYGIYKQVDGVEALADADLLRFELIFAVGFVILLGLRLGYMKATQTSALPADTARWQVLAAKAVHYGMYVSLSAIAITGILIGLIYTPETTESWTMEAAIMLHEFAVTASYVLIGIHVVAALYHRYLRDGVWSAMVPVFKE